MMGSTGCESFVQVTSGGGEPWASQSRVTSSPVLTTTRRGASASWDSFLPIWGLAVAGRSGVVSKARRATGSRGRAVTLTLERPGSGGWFCHMGSVQIAGEAQSWPEPLPASHPHLGPLKPQGGIGDPWGPHESTEDTGPHRTHICMYDSDTSQPAGDTDPSVTPHINSERKYHLRSLHFFFLFCNIKYVAPGGHGRQAAAGTPCALLRCVGQGSCRSSQWLV